MTQSSAAPLVTRPSNETWLRAFCRVPELIFALSLAGAALHVAWHLEWNLDGVFYAALMSTETQTLEETHRSVYQQIAAFVPAPAAFQLTEGSDNRIALQHDLTRFTGQLPFYVTKPLYAALGRVFNALGVPSILAPYAVSLLSFILLGLSLPQLAQAAGADRSSAYLATALAVWLPFFRELGALATPDATSTMLLVSGAGLLFSRTWLGASLLVAAALVRPDAAMLGAGIFCAVQLFSAPQPYRARNLLFVAALLILPFLVPIATGGYSWSAVIRHTFLEAVSDNASAQRDINMDEYLTALRSGFDGAMTKQTANFAPYLALAIFSAIFRRRDGEPRQQKAALTLTAVIWAATLARFIAMPLMADRFFAPAYIVTLAMSSALIAPSWRPTVRLEGVHRLPTSGR